MTSTRGNPRIGQSSGALSSLGAVGGPRGTAAGALRVLVEFLTQYDPSAVKALESDLTSLTALESQLGNREVAIADRVSRQKIKISQAEALIKAKFRDRDAKALLAESTALRATGRSSDLIKARQSLNLAIQKAGLSKAEERVVRNLIAGRTRLLTLEKAQTAAAANRLGVAEQQNAVEAQLGSFKSLKSGVLPKLGGLALGAAGGLVGGAILGAGFAAAQAVLDSIAEGFKDIIDPARHSREAIKEVGDAINELTSGGELTREQAAKQFLTNLGLGADDATVAILARAAAQKTLNDALKEEQTINLVKKNSDALDKENLKIKIDLLIAEAEARGELKYLTEISDSALTDFSGAQQQTIDIGYYTAQALAENTRQLTSMDAATRNAAASQRELQRALQDSAALATIAAASLSAAISAGSAAAFTSPLDSRIANLQGADAESSKTRGIQAKIDQLQNKSQGDGGRGKELANIAEERAILLLKQRLALLGTEIDLSKFSGKFLQVAIEAKIKALDKQARAQDRLNKLLDLQFKMSQTLRRNQGESVVDFVERRAQNNRELLSEQRDLERERIKESLQEQKDKVDLEVQLSELAERQKTASAKQGSDSRIKNLQKELAASKKADSEALKNKIAALEKQREGYEKLADNAKYYSTVTANEEIRQAVRAANSVEKIASLSGTTRGLESAKAFLTALLQSGVLSPSEAKQVSAAINRISGTLSKIGDQQYNISRNSITRPGTAPTPFAHGGLIPLNAGSTPFGNQARFGEHGTEAALILSNAVMNKMQNRKGQSGFGDINIYRSEDPQRDYWRTKQMIREVVREEFN